MTTSKQIINQAKAWIGKKESDGSFKEIIDTYNAHKPLARGYAVQYNDEWCATFISALAIKCNATDIIPTECSCQKQIELCKAKGIWVENENRTPNVGDIIYYDWQDDGKGDNKGWSDHVGIVEKVSNGKITVIEGNLSQKVGRRTIEVNAKYIRGYATPKYEVEKVAQKKSLEEIVKEVIAGKWGNGDARKKSLTDAGYNYNEVQAKINEMYAPKIKKGSKVKIKSGAVYSGASKGKKVPLWVRLKKHTVADINNNKKEARLKEINSWVALSSLTLVK